MENAPSSDPSLPWALQLEAEILLEAERFEGVFDLCQRAQALNAQRIALASAAPGRRLDEIEARIVGIQIAHRKADLWRRLGLVERFDSAVGEMLEALELLRRIARDADDLVDAEYTTGYDATAVALAQGRSEDALENCRRLRERCLRRDLPQTPARRREVDLLEATAQHNRSFEGRFDPALARRNLLALAEAPDAPAWIVHEALLLLVDLQLRDRLWDEARPGIQRLRALELSLGSMPLENRARLCAFEAELALGSGAAREILLEHRDALERAIQAVLENWISLPPPPGGFGVLLWGTQRASVAAQFDLELALDDGAEGAARALQALVRVQQVGTLARRMHAPAVDVAALAQRLLDERSACLAYFPAPNATYLFVVTREGVLRPLLLPGQDEVWHRIDAWLEVANAPIAGTDDPLAREERRRALFERGRAVSRTLLPEEALARIGACSQLYVLGIEHLRKLPLPRLPLEDGTPLGVSHALSYLPSIPVALHLCDRASKVPASLVLIGAPTTSEPVRARWPNVIDFALEPAQVDALCGGLALDSSPRFLGSEAWLSPAVRACLQQSGLGLVLGHGVWDEQAERPPAIQLATGDGRDGRMDCDAIERLEQVPPLVELLACGSDRGRVRFGDDSNSLLSAALFERGACCVITASTDVRLQPTIAFASAVNARILNDGASPAEAVRAEREARWRDPRTRELDESAGFVVAGLGFRSVVSAPRATHAPLDASEPGSGSRIPAGLAVLGFSVLSALALLALVFRRGRRRGRA